MNPNSAAHHASEHAAKARYAMDRKIAGGPDAEFWDRKCLLHIVVSNRPICHADLLMRFAAMTDGNPMLTTVLKKFAVPSFHGGSSQGSRAAQPETPFDPTPSEAQQ